MGENSPNLFALAGALMEVKATTTILCCCRCRCFLFLFFPRYQN
jgi:hypothetical protein